MCLAFIIVSSLGFASWIQLLLLLCIAISSLVSTYCLRSTGKNEAMSSNLLVYIVNIIETCIDHVIICIRHDKMIYFIVNVIMFHQSAYFVNMLDAASLLRSGNFFNLHLKPYLMLLLNYLLYCIIVHAVSTYVAPLHLINACYYLICFLMRNFANRDLRFITNITFNVIFD